MNYFAFLCLDWSIKNNYMTNKFIPKRKQWRYTLQNVELLLYVGLIMLLGHHFINKPIFILNKVMLFAKPKIVYNYKALLPL